MALCQLMHLGTRYIYVYIHIKLTHEFPSPSKLKFFQKLQFFILTEKLAGIWGLYLKKKIHKHTKFLPVKTFEKSHTKIES